MILRPVIIIYMICLDILTKQITNQEICSLSGNMRFICYTHKLTKYMSTHIAIAQNEEQISG